MIKTTHGEAARAQKILQGFTGREMNTRTAYRMLKLKRELETEIEFLGEEQMKLIRKHGFSVEPDGRVLFGERGEEFDEYLREWDAVLAEEADIEAEKIDLRGENDLRMSIEEMEALEPFVIME